MRKRALFLFISFFLSVLSGNDLNLAFSAAVQAGNLAEAGEIFAKGADINFVDDDWPLFISAVTSGDLPMTEFFLKNGVNVELKGPDGKTALLHALSIKNEKLVKMLVDANANLMAEDLNKKNVTMYAAEANNLNLLQNLIKMGVDINLKSSDGKRALDYAIDARAQKCYRFLSRLESLPMDFIEAVAKGDEAAVKTLIGEGADVNAKDKRGKAAVAIAVERGFTPILKLLLEKGADPNGRYFKNPKATLFLLAMHNKRFETALLLIRSGASADFNHRYQGGKTALMLAISNNKTELANCILQKEQDLNITDEFGHTALISAAENNLYSLVVKLLEKGADPTIRQVDGKTAKEIAKSKNFSSIVMVLNRAEAKMR